MKVSHRHLSDWYSSMGSRLEAGISIIDALEDSGKIGRISMDWFVDSLKRGNSVDDTLRAAPEWFPQRDRFLISAAAESGKMSQAFVLLSVYHEDMEDNIRQWKQALVYPVLMIHAIILAQPLMGMLNFERSIEELIRWYLWQVVPVLAIFWGTWIGLGFCISRSDGFKRFLGRFIPGLGTFFRNQSYYNFASTMENFLEAGISFEESLAASALVSDNQKIKAASLKALDLIRRGTLPSKAFEQVKLFPPTYQKYYAAGEQTGTQPKQLGRIGNDAKRRSLEAIKRMRFWYPKLILGVVFLIVAYKTITGFNAYLENILQMMDQ